VYFQTSSSCFIICLIDGDCGGACALNPTAIDKGMIAA
jgi:hypothetical protein